MNKKCIFFLLVFFTINAEWKEIIDPAFLSINSIGLSEIDELVIGDNNTIWGKVFKRVPGKNIIKPRWFQWKDGSWQGPYGNWSKLSISKNNDVYAFNKISPYIFNDVQDRLKQLNIDRSTVFLLDNGKWQPTGLDICLSDLAAIDSHDMWALRDLGKAGFRAFHWDGTHWQQKGDENVIAIYASHDGTVIAKQRIIYLQGKKAELRDLQTLNDEMTAEYKTVIVQWNGKSWEPLNGVEEKYIGQIAVINKDSIWAVLATGNIRDLHAYPHKWDFKKNEWVRFGDIKSNGLIVSGPDGTVLMQSQFSDKMYVWMEDSACSK